MLLNEAEVKKKLLNYHVKIICEENEVYNQFVPQLLVNKVFDCIEEMDGIVDSIYFKDGLKAKIMFCDEKGKTENVKIKLSKKELYKLYFDSDSKNEEMMKYIEVCGMTRKLWEKVNYMQDYLKDIKYDLDRIEKNI